MSADPEKKSVLGQINQAYRNVKSRSVFNIMMSYNVITTVTDFFWQYQLALVYVTAASFAAATSWYFMIGAIASFIISVAIAPYFNKNVKNETIGLALPIVLLVLVILFFGLILFPGPFALMLAALGWQNANILLISCIVGGIIDILQKSLRYSITDVFNLKVWDKVDKENRSSLQSTTNMYSGRPIKGLVSLLIILLIALSFGKTLASTAWIMPSILAIFFWFWISSVHKISPAIKDKSISSKCDSTQQVAPQEKTSTLDMIKSYKFWIMASLCVMFVFGTTFLSVLKTTLIVSSAGAESLIWLKAIIIPTIFGVHFLVNKFKETYKENSFYAIIILANVLFILFAVIFPYSNLIHSMIFSFSCLPSGLSGIFNFWLFSLFYIFAEIWSVVSMDILYSPMQNDVFKDKELGVSIPLIAAASCIGQFSASFFTKYMASIGLSTSLMLWVLAGAFLVTTVVVVCLYRYAQVTKMISNNNESKKSIDLNNQVGEMTNNSQVQTRTNDYADLSNCVAT